MAINTTTLSNSIKSAMDTAFAVTDPALRNATVQQLCDDIAQAVAVAIKEGVDTATITNTETYVLTAGATPVTPPTGGITVTSTISTTI